jgi:hypothetical protein
MNLYLDVDGVFLGRQDAAEANLAIAKHAEAFLDFALRHFDCYWLTTHCDGTQESVLRYLRPYCSEDLLKKLAEVRPTQFRTVKPEALEGDFYWVEDAPLQAEIEWLKSRGLLPRWIEVNTRKRPDDLLTAMSRLRTPIVARNPTGS